MSHGAPGCDVYEDAEDADILADEEAPSMSKKRNPLPPSKRVTIGLCESGDIAELSDGRRCVVSDWLNGGPFGRWLDSDGVEGEFMPISGSLACRVVRRVNGAR